MAELVRVDASSLAEIEAFLREELAERVTLGDVRLAVGRTGAAIAAVACASAVTLGSVVCLAEDRSRALVNAPEGARTLDVLGSLLVHECVHVWQYRRTGTPRFLSAYCFSYLSSIRTVRRVDLESRASAYRAIPAEREAFRIEARWRSRARS